MFGSISTLILVCIGLDGFGLHAVGVKHVSLPQDGFLETWSLVSGRLGWDLRVVVLGVAG